MQLRVTSEAVQRFQSEWGFVAGDSVRVFVRYSGFSATGPYSFGIMKDSPRYPAVTVQLNGITFYMEQNDIWFLENEQLTIDERNEEIVFVREG
ncbi:Fe-S cluster assembly protein HesB [Paenibacillus sp. ACRRX]|uniref:HesB/YadR/YfhF family protein n=1 Tax=unclassified Paenibacillus TaxID=185978 RepID=UPI001EF5BCF7|nr:MULTISPECIES: Fe-S cluster assembly protein HesB [unclassified Paenibacillus]MCG7407385.1 Fe-S cluster assembly protein HesB [Paenibacillus sp. ACRRX]MDK8180611.1 Fe-S cluster assembly protein HesB [Paenibacillus sp. UMB4589-SE434]